MAVSADNLSWWVHNAGLAMQSLIFLANAFGILDQRVAQLELESAGVSRGAASAAVSVGRMVQVLCIPLLFVDQSRLYAAAMLVAFLAGATCAGHAFWRAPPGSERDRQLAGFLKNCAIAGGLVITALWKGQLA